MKDENQIVNLARFGLARFRIVSDRCIWIGRRKKKKKKKKRSIQHTILRRNARLQWHRTWPKNSLPLKPSHSWESVDGDTGFCFSFNLVSWMSFSSSLTDPSLMKLFVCSQMNEWHAYFWIILWMFYTNAKWFRWSLSPFVTWSRYISSSSSSPSPLSSSSQVTWTIQHLNKVSRAKTVSGAGRPRWSHHTLECQHNTMAASCSCQDSKLIG